MWCVHPKQLGFSFNRRKDGAGCKHLIDSSDQAKKSQQKTYKQTNNQQQQQEHQQQQQIKKTPTHNPSCKTIMLWLASSECKLTFLPV